MRGRTRHTSRLTRLETRLAMEKEFPLSWPLAASLGALSVIYRGLCLADRLPYRLGLRRPADSGIPVIGLGNLMVGGTGKTPCAIWLANSLRQAGRRPVMLAHGYKSGSGQPLVVSRGEGREDPPAAAGDEARLAAISCPGIPVVAGRDRVAAAALARRLFAPDVLVADDIFQYWPLRRLLDLVLLDAADPFGNGRLLPRGRLREPVGALARAGGLILIGEGAPAADLPPDIPAFAGRIRPLSLTGWEEWRRGERRPIGDGLRGMEVAAFCGLARPERFFTTLAGLGLHVTGRLVAADHDLPAPEDLARLAAAGRGPLLTTEKDAVKLTLSLVERVGLAGRDLRVLGVEFQPATEDLLSFILAALEDVKTQYPAEAQRHTPWGDE